MRKVFKQDKDYELKIRRNGWVVVYYQGRAIGHVLNEGAARQVIWLHSGKKHFVSKSDFEVVG